MPRRDTQHHELDPHEAVVTRSLADFAAVFARVAGDDPSSAVDAEIERAVAAVQERIAGRSVFEIADAARLVCFVLPQSRPEWSAGADSGARQSELLVLLAASVDSTEQQAIDMPHVEAVGQSLEDLDELATLGVVRSLGELDKEDRGALLGFMSQHATVSTRTTSYPEAVGDTIATLFDGEGIADLLRTELGFDARDALAVLAALERVQTARLAGRMEALAIEMSHAGGQENADDLSDADRVRARVAFDALWEPPQSELLVDPAEVAREAGVTSEVARSVLQSFALPTSTTSGVDVVAEFLRGVNPLRSHPVLMDDRGHAMLLHAGGNEAAIRERLEAVLQGSRSWQTYQKHRGDVLESKTRRALERLLPDAQALHGFTYFVPNDDLEDQGPPSGYSKRVEADHLVVVDDVAIIVEDKAGAVSAAARSGDSVRLRRNLRDLVSAAATQGSRTARRVVGDGGLRLGDGSWLDLSPVREIHIVTVSLEDLLMSTTATAELLREGLIDADAIPWSVSIHDLELIAQLVRRPEEFVLYLRRRRHPRATVRFLATDELDLFIEFLRAGLYVEPVAEEVAEFGFLSDAQRARIAASSESDTGEFVLSRTDPLDRWWSFEHMSDAERDRVGDPPQPPRMAPSPIDGLVAEVESKADFGGVSIAATLLSFDESTRRRVAGMPRQIARASGHGQRERSAALPLATFGDGGWLLVFATRATVDDAGAFSSRLIDYLAAKRHQLGLARGALFVIDAGGRVESVSYDAGAELTEAQTARLSTLRDAPDTQTLAQITMAWRTGQREQPRRQSKRKRKK